MHALRLIAQAVLAAAVLSFAAPAAAQGLDDLRYRVATLEAELAALRARTAGAAAGGMQERLDRLEEEVRALTGKLEEIAHRQRQIAEDARRRFGDIEFRLTELEGGDIANVAEPAPLGGVGESAGQQTQTAAISISEREELDRAIADVEQGRYDSAEEKLRRFLLTYGETPLRAKALMWLGESQLTRGAYREAARSFLDGYNSDLTGENAPKTLYRLGVTLGRLGQLNDACLTLAEVPRQFPDAPGALLDDAESEAERLGCG